jgi:hypothetical protein
LAGQQFSSKPFRAENAPLKNIVNEDLWIVITLEILKYFVEVKFSESIK